MKTFTAFKPTWSETTKYTAVLLLFLSAYITKAQCTPGGNQGGYGNNSWIGYVYSGLDSNNPPQNAFTPSNYKGYVTQPEQFDLDLGTGAISGANLCGSYSDSFSIRFRMRKNFAAGYYTFTIGGDDGVRLSIVNGGNTHNITDWNYHSYQTITQTFYLSGSADLVLETYDQGGFARVSFSYTTCVGAATAPTGISGTTSVCSGSSTTLTATGGTGNSYQWGTGSVIGENIISGQTAQSISVTPTGNTQYWVRRTNGSCGETTGVNTPVTVNSPAGDQVSFGNDSWIGYAYATIDTSNPPTNAFTTSYRGYLTQPEIFNMNLGSTPLSGANICGSYDVRFAIRFKMRRNLPEGYYTFTVGGDDGYRLSINGTQVINNWNDHGYTTSNTTSMYLNGSTDFILEYYEQQGVSQVSFNYTACTNLSTAPTDISGDSSVCRGSSITLTATGGTASNGVSYQWGTGTNAGSNIINNQNGQSIMVSPTSNTTYWVRRTTCNGHTSIVTKAITVRTPSAAPTNITGTTTICNGGSTTLTATGGSNASGVVYQWGTGSVGQNIIASATTASITVSPATTTTYWVRKVDTVSPCTSPTTEFSRVVTVNESSTAPTDISGGQPLCSTWGITLVANGGTSASNAQFQWGTGTNPGSNVINTTNGNTLWVDPAQTTTYWVRRYDASCSRYTDAVFNIVYKGSTGPWDIAWIADVCPNATATLTANGGTVSAGSLYQWGTGTTAGQNIISGQTGSTLSISPSQTTTYWVRIVGTACEPTQAVFRTVNVQGQSTPPSSIQGSNELCSNSGTTLTANGAALVNGGEYQWGTGTVLGQNVNGQTSGSLWVNPSVTTTYWVRAYDRNCNAYRGGVFHTITVSTPSTQPSWISGAEQPLCPGSSLVLTANGGTHGTNAIYEWGTGWTVGSNIIAGENNATITVSPTVQTVYWVRRVGTAPCNSTTQGPTTTVNMSNNGPTAPTSVNGGGTICPGVSRTLTANGGSGNTYQWGIGSVIGENPIANQTNQTISVNPTVTTVYWVRRYNPTCGTYTNGATTTVTINVPGNPEEFGVNSWIAYGYSTGDITLATAAYAGYYTQNTLGIDAQAGTNNWNQTASPSSSAGWQGCNVPVDHFTLVYKRKGFTCGTYAIAMNNWDDAVQIYINGTLVWSCNSYSGGNACNTNVGSFDLNSESQIEVHLRENGGNANLKVSITKTDVASTRPDSLTGNNVGCPGAETTLTVNGGVHGTNAVYQWGTGTVTGENIIDGATEATLTVNPMVTTTYWVRRVNAFCGGFTAIRNRTITVQAGTVAGSLSPASTTVCRNSVPGNITLSGHTGNVVKWQYADNSSFTEGLTDIASTATVLTGATIGRVPSTRYYRAVVQKPGCVEAITAGVVITVPDAVIFDGTWSATPTSVTPVIIKSDMILTSNLNVCSCEVTDNALITVRPNVTLIVQREIVVDASANIIVENHGSIVQVDDDATDIGSITVKRNSTPMKNMDFTYWSSPVIGWKLNQLSPNTLADKYYSYNPVAGNWSIIQSGNQIMQPGKGYIVRAPQGWSLTNATQGVFNGVFTGVPNTGVIPTTIQKGNSVLNLIGNPYPSAIDIDEFLTNPENANIVNGTVYLWTHNTAIAPSSVGYQYTANDYAKYNLTGGVVTASTAISGNVRPTGKIASGQAFFIEAKSNLAAGNYNVNFSNSMRVVNRNNQFFRVNQQENTTMNSVEKHRIWVRMSNTSGAYDETLLGYLTGATDEKDNLYDGNILAGGNSVSIYSILDTDKLSIQGRALPFSDQQVIPMGYKTTVAGTFSIGLDQFDGLFQDQVVFLVDKTDNSYHNLKESDYTFTTAIGTYDGRFELRFVSSTLGTNDPVANQNNVFVSKNQNHIQVNTGNASMKSVTVYDLTGKTLYTKNGINATSHATSDFEIATQVLIVKVTLEDNQVVTKKLIM